MFTKKFLLFLQEKFLPHAGDAALFYFMASLLAFTFHYSDTAVVWPQTVGDYALVALVGFFHGLTGLLFCSVATAIVLLFVYLKAKILDYCIGRR